MSGPLLVRVSQPPRFGGSFDEAIVQIATSRRISLRDHFIAGNSGHTSLKGMKLI
jgi:hypothetical protein